MALPVPAQGAGYFGKVSSHGDFVSRRLSASFTAAWDAWLQDAMRRSRESLGADWLDAYLTAPVWRFALAPGVCDSCAWAGVLMPSVDRVGRYFPLTVATALPAAAALLDLAESAGRWYADLEQLALSSLDAQGFTLEHFDALLRAMPPPPVCGAHEEERTAAQSGFLHLAIPDLDSLAPEMPALGRRIAEACLAGQSLWWSRGSKWVPPSMVLCRGLPGEKAFGAMLKGFKEGNASRRTGGG